jgi:hypothetical protein
MYEKHWSIIQALQHISKEFGLFFDTEDRGGTVFKNITGFLLNYIALYSKDEC